jgi:hypothetical protein
MHCPRFTTTRSAAAAIALAAAVVPGVTLLPGASAAAAPAAAAVARCATPGLVVWLNTDGNGAAGSLFYNLELTNLSGHTCTLFGYPGVSAVNLEGQQLGSAAARDPAHKPGVVSLGRGGTASMVLRIVEAGNFPSAACRPVTAAGLRVYPPGQTASKVVPFPFGACSKRGPAFLTVRAVQRG